MTVTTAEIMTWIGAFFWPFMRIGAMMLVAPVLGDQQVSVRLRLLLAVALTVGVMPVAGLAPAVEPLSAEGLLISMQQVVIGMAMGLLMALALQTASLAGESVALSMGLGFANMVDPVTGQSTPVVSQFLLVIATLIFLTVGGHLMLIELLAESFVMLPVGTEGLMEQQFRTVAGWGAQMYAGAVLIALPAVVLLLLVYLSLGVMTRAAPQMNIFSVGFPVTMLVGFLALMTLVVPSLPGRLSGIWSDAFNTIGQILGGG